MPEALISFPQALSAIGPKESLLGGPQSFNNEHWFVIADDSSSRASLPVVSEKEGDIADGTLEPSSPTSDTLNFNGFWLDLSAGTHTSLGSRSCPLLS